MERLPGAARHEPFLLRRQKQVTGRCAEVLWQDVEIDRGILLGCGNEDGALGHDRHPEVRLVIPVRPEHEEVIVASMGTQVIQERRGDRPILAEPFFLELARRAAIEYLVAELGEALEPAATRDRKPDQTNAVLHGSASWIGVCPSDVIARTCRQDCDVVAQRQALGKLPAMGLGAARDVRAVPLYDKRELHVLSMDSGRDAPAERRLTSRCRRAFSTASS